MGIRKKNLLCFGFSCLNNYLIWNELTVRGVFCPRKKIIKFFYYFSFRPIEPSFYWKETEWIYFNFFTKFSYIIYFINYMTYICNKDDGLLNEWIRMMDSHFIAPIRISFFTFIVSNNNKEVSILYL